MKVEKFKNNNIKNYPKVVHLCEIDGYVKISDKSREKFKVLIINYGIRKLAKKLNFDRETIYSIYKDKNRKDIHSINHLQKIAVNLGYNLKKLESEVTHYGTRQGNMYVIKFPFTLSPLHLRAVTIHGDGSFFNKNNCIHAEWYQSGNSIKFMENLLNKVNINNPIKSRIKSKENNINAITIPSHLIRLVCKSLDLKLENFHSIDFFKKVAKLPSIYSIQVFFQFLIDEGHFKGTTLTISQKKNWSRNGLKVLLESLNFGFSNPLDDKQDITIYNYNFHKIFEYLIEAKNRFGSIAGLWFIEREFLHALKKVNPDHYPQIKKSEEINKMIIKKLRKTKPIFSYQDIKSFKRTHAQANKAIRCWKKNKIIERIGWNRYKILQEGIK